MLGAYAAGRYKQQTDPQVLAGRPFWLYDAVLDSGTTPICRGLNELIRRHDDPIWQRIYPPNHYGCRAGVRSLTTAEARARGGPTQQVQPIEVPPGFARPPTTSWEPDPSKYDPELWEVFQSKLAERIEIGREILEVRGKLSTKELDVLKRGIEGLNINRWIRQNPIQHLEVAPRFNDLQAGTMGQYDATTQTLRIIYPRPENTWGQRLRLGALDALSTIGRTDLEAASITVVHEFAHHLYLGLREEHENRLFARYIEAKKERKFVSSRASISVLEWFSEMIAAYRFARSELHRFDPESFAILKRLLDDLR